MLKNYIILVCSLFFSACATNIDSHRESVSIKPEDVRIVMAKKIDIDKNPIEVKSTFNLEGKIYAYIALNWDPYKEGGNQKIEIKWFNGDKLITFDDIEKHVKYPPHFFWFDLPTIALGVGECHVEIFANGKLLGKKYFTIKE